MPSIDARASSESSRGAPFAFATGNRTFSQNLNAQMMTIVLAAQVPRNDREGILADLRVCFMSTAAELASLAHQCSVLQRVMQASNGDANPEHKATFAHGIAKRQFDFIARRLRDICKESLWADVEPVSLPPFSIIRLSAYITHFLPDR
jgi:hypothetical protein